MSDFKYIKDTYDVPADMFREVMIDGKKGVITEDKGHYLGVTFYHNSLTLPCHPTWRTEYLETFNLVPLKPKNHKAKARYCHFLSLDSDMTFMQYLKSKHKI